MIERIKLPTETINKVAAVFGVSPEEYIALSRSISLGYSVCAHFEGTESDGKISVFSLG
jgi:plasmid maintenance system antidote protein VapI